VAWTLLGPGLRADERYDGDIARLRLAGELDLVTAPLAEQLLVEIATGSAVAIIDLAWVTFLDAYALRCLLRARAAIERAGGEMVVERAHPRVRRVLELTDTAQRLGVGRETAPPAPVSTDALTILEDTIDAAVVGADGDTVNAQLLDAPSRSLRIVAQRGFARPFLDFFEVVDGTESACGAALADQGPVWVPDVTMSDIFAGSPALEAMLDANSLAVASIPVIVPTGELVAMFSVHRRRPGDWTPKQRAALAVLGREAGRSFAAC
jgi:anti-anti-sigma factor